MTFAGHAARAAAHTGADIPNDTANVISPEPPADSSMTHAGSIDCIAQLFDHTMTAGMSWSSHELTTSGTRALQRPQRQTFGLRVANEAIAWIGRVGSLDRQSYAVAACGTSVDKGCW